MIAMEQNLNRKTIGNMLRNPRKYVTCTKVSINVMSQQSGDNWRLTPKTALNSFNDLGVYMKTFCANLAHARCVFQLDSICAIMGTTPPPERAAHEGEQEQTNDRT